VIGFRRPVVLNESIVADTPSPFDQNKRPVIGILAVVSWAMVSIGEMTYKEIFGCICDVS
jgi:hypothetical protein